jgi:hypothetical protein
MRAIAVITAAAALFLTVGSAVAQTAQPPARPMPAPEARPPEPREVEGTVSKVDPASQTIGVSRGWFGLLGRTLQVTDQTEIRVNGRGASLGEIQEGAKVKASFEIREGKNVAKSIEVSPDLPPAKGASRPATQ